MRSPCRVPRRVGACHAEHPLPAGETTARSISRHARSDRLREMEKSRAPRHGRSRSTSSTRSRPLEAAARADACPAYEAPRASAAGLPHAEFEGRDQVVRTPISARWNTRYALPGIAMNSVRPAGIGRAEPAHLAVVRRSTAARWMRSDARSVTFRGTGLGVPITFTRSPERSERPPGKEAARVIRMHPETTAAPEARSGRRALRPAEP